jgi:hypothetical protein
MRAWCFFASVCFLGSLACSSEPAPRAVVQGAHEAQPSAWRWVDPPPVDGDLQPSCSNAPNFDVDPSGATLFPTQYRFLVRQGREDKLVLFFDGGGACWDVESCIHIQSFNQWLDFSTTDLDEGTVGGFFDASNPENPVRDWTFVLITYCTGDLHTGTKDTTYGGYTIRHRGWINAGAALEWTRRRYPEPAQVLVTGSSAGGYGAHYNFARVAGMFRNATHISHLADGSTLSPSDAAFAYIRSNWGAQALEQMVRGYATLAPQFPRVHFGLYASEHDETLVGFRSLLCDTLPGLDPACTGCPVCDFQDKVTADLAYASSAPNFRYYISAGDVHTITEDPLFYTEASAGVRFRDWFADLVRLPGETAAPQSAACPDCLAACPRADVCGPVPNPPPGQ